MAVDKSPWSFISLVISSIVHHERVTGNMFSFTFSRLGALYHSVSKRDPTPSRWTAWVTGIIRNQFTNVNVLIIQFVCLLKCRSLVDRSLAFFFFLFYAYVSSVDTASSSPARFVVRHLLFAKHETSNLPLLCTGWTSQSVIHESKVVGMFNHCSAINWYKNSWFDILNRSQWCLTRL